MAEAQATGVGMQNLLIVDLARAINVYLFKDLLVKLDLAVAKLRKYVMLLLDPRSH
jgi:hypothetical protein